MGKIRTAYTLLAASFGPQGWWPTTPHNSVQPTYSGGPKNERQMFEVIVGSILTQNTSWKNAEKAIINLHRHNLLDLEKLDAVPEKKLALLIKSSGYYNQKAKKITHALLFLREYPLRELKKLPLSELRRVLLGVPGIGKETADSIALYAFKRPIFVVDAYTRRIFSRIGIITGEEEYDEIRKKVEREFSPMPDREKAKAFNEYHALIVQQGKDICKKEPACQRCPLSKGCRYTKQNIYKALNPV
ncbi:MAG: endonuclease [Nanoarchaeota archaeon]